MEDESKVIVYNSDKPTDQSPVSAVDLSKTLQKLMLRLKGEFMADDGKGVDYSKFKTSQLFPEYKKQACQLQNIDLNTLSEVEKKVFFISILLLTLLKWGCPK
ncbi:hypothetical protein LOTGIDRAFT_175345 [Lottia gigantea]|uniref:Uncharacterized protein n=1 Tax=Lottia gigantea TaxID=225164 RepID=V4AHM6_LOTGI|nr:hypothetical protein LOTGIDRAFT_175345 [Lottia gigantea]ESO94705.1 hypothetical protein LOTGIDRAFT_175345 [Lottia gigantea]